MTIAFENLSSTKTLDSNTNEQTVFTFTPVANNLINGIWLDLTNLTQNCTLRVYYMVDGTNYRVFQTTNWNTSMDDGVLIDGDIPVAASKSLKVTLQSSVAEGATRSIPYEYWTQGLGSLAVALVYTETNSISGAALAGVQVWVTTDSAGSNVIASGITNASGQITFYLSNYQTYYFWRVSSLYSFTNPNIITVTV